MRFVLIAVLTLLALPSRAVPQQIVPLIEKSALKEDLVWNKWDKIGRAHV